jgi:Mg-chelatase subunit ChlD
MSPDFPQNEREQLEVKLTAFLLGELPPDETVALCKAMESDPELAALYERLKLTIGLVRESVGNPAEQTTAQPAPLKLSEDRREKLLAQFKTIEPEEFVRPRRVMDWLVPVAAVSAIVMILAALLLPALSAGKTKARSASAKNTVINNLLLLDGAKEQWALENHKPGDAEPTLEELKPYLGRGPSDIGILSVAGETYVPGKVSEAPKVETTAREAEHLFGKDVVANAEVQNGKVLISPLGRDTVQMAEQKTRALRTPSLGAAASSVAPAQNKPIQTEQLAKAVEDERANIPMAAPPPPVSTDVPVPMGRIVLPESIQVAKAPAPAADQTTTDSLVVRYAVSSDISRALKKLDDEQTNIVALNVTNWAANGDSYNSDASYRMLSQLDSGVSAASGALRYIDTNGAVGSRALAANELGRSSFDVRTNAAVLGWYDAQGGTRANGIITRSVANDSVTESAEVGRKGEIVLPAAQPAAQDYSNLQANGGSMPDYRLRGAGGGGAGGSPSDSLASTKSTPSARAKQMKIAAANAITGLDATTGTPTGRFPGSVTYFATKQVPQLGLTNQLTDTALPKPAIPPPTPQPEILTRENAFSSFSLNVSDVSFKLAAASLEKGQLPEPASIRSEEFINAFDYRDPEAPPGVPIAFTSERARYPFAHNRELLRFSLKTAAAGRQAGRPLNIVLLLDNSGSMERADRVRIIQEALRVLAGQLQAQDTFSIVTFARTANLRVDGIPGNQAAAAAEEIAKLTPEGGTNLGEALDLAYQTALHHYLANGDNRVVMLTDGAANLGEVNADALKQKVEAHRKQGIALDCFGIGWEGYNDDLLEVLTRNGDGRYGFINTPEEAGTEFVAQIAGALHVAAADVKVQVEFNPKRVVSYRQIGYAKHQLTKEQFRDNTVDAAEIAAQEAGNALYTIEINPQGEGSIGTVRVRYKVPGTSEYREQAWDVPYTGSAVALDQASAAMRLAATASAFSEWLATSPFAAEVTPDQLLRYLNGVPQVYGADTRPAKLEWMIRQAKSISGK